MPEYLQEKRKICNLLDHNYSPKIIPDIYKNDIEICYKIIEKNPLNYNLLNSKIKEILDIKVEAISNNYAFYNNLLGNYKFIDKKTIFMIIDKTKSLKNIPSYNYSLDIKLYALEKNISNMKYIK